MTWTDLKVLDLSFTSLSALAIEVKLADVEFRTDDKSLGFVKDLLLHRRFGTVVIESPELTVSLLDDERGIVVSEVVRKKFDVGFDERSLLVYQEVPSKGTHFDLIVTHVVSPQHFYVQTMESKKLHEASLLEQIEFYENGGSSLKISGVRKGDLVAVKAGG